MKTIVKIPLRAVKKVAVSEGQALDPDETLALFSEFSPDLEINLSVALKVKPKEVHNFLKKKPGENIVKSEIIAEKKSFLTRTSVKSPITGKLKLVDLIRGSVILAPGGQEHAKLTVPVPCRIKSVGRDTLEIEVKGEKYIGETGEGIDVCGQLLDVSTIYRSVHDVSNEIEDKIVLVSNATEELMAKIDTLGGIGIITDKISRKYTFPHVTVSSAEFKTLVEKNGKTVWLRPSVKEIIVCESLQ